MALQSPMEQLKSARIGRSALIALAAGIVVGLALGLLIGWVWWPVDWQGPTPAPETASTAGLSPAVKANYMGAIADAYVANPDSTAATALAAQRLADLGGDMPTNFGSAIQYYASQAQGTTQIDNLNRLASAVGVPLQGSTAQANPVAAVAATSAATEQAQPTDSGSGGGIGWLVGLLAALFLVGGGAYILWRTLSQRADSQEPVDGFADEDIGTDAAPAATSFNRSSLSPLTPAGTTASAAPRPRPAPSGPYGFDAEDDDDVYPPTGFRSMGSASSLAPLPDDPDMEPEDEEDDTLDNYPTPPPAAYVTSIPAAATRPEQRQPVATSAQPVAEPANTPLATSTTRSVPPVPPKPAVPSRYERYTPVENYTATYQVGVADFDYTKNVENPDGAGYIGEYGIGISERHGLLNNSLEQVVALEVYLFDKTDETQMVTVTRALLSEYAHDNLYTFFDREKQSADPITAQPGTNFQLEGRQLLLDCTVTDVRYASDGVFKNVVVDMVLKRRT